tara:strand:- start:8408 stop:8578 length:171 start_codon:yes stop_codon:yes gene_type:complete
MTNKKPINYHCKKLIEYLENNIEPTHFEDDIIWTEGHDPGDEDSNAWEDYKKEKDQ